jgi:hypothetical protein
MRRWMLWSAAFSSLAFCAVDAQAQLESAFVEGHVFNFESLRPITRAKVDVYIACSTCTDVRSLVASDVTDRNGFYEVAVPLFVRESPINFDAIVIQVSCPTLSGPITGTGDAKIRADTLRRDVYLRAPEELVRCGQPPL